jgi:hypothetical protein
MSDRENAGKLSEDVLSEIIDFFISTPSAGYQELSKFVKSKNIDYYDMDHALTVLAGSFVGFVYGGLFMKSKTGLGDIDAEQLSMGISVEKEHTDNELIARKIALDHLVEIPDYYTRLSEMESAAKGGKGENK